MKAKLPAAPDMGTAEGRRRYAVKKQLRALIRQRQSLLQLLQLYRRQCAAGSAEHRAHTSLLTRLQEVEVWRR